MIKIDIFGYLSDLNRSGFEKKSFEEIKEELKELHEYNIVFEELEKSSIFGTENSMHIGNDTFVQARSLISEIKQKQEITQKLNSLGYNLDLLRISTIMKDKKNMLFLINHINKNKYCSITSIISELNSLKSSIDGLENLHMNLLNSGLSLDIKTLIEQDFRKKHKKLDELYYKQKNILLNLSTTFIKFAKDSVLNIKN